MWGLQQLARLHLVHRPGDGTSLRIRPPVPPSVRGQPEARAWLWDMKAKWHANLEACGSVRVARPDQSSIPACRALVLVAHLSPAVRAAGRENAPEWPGAVRQIWKSSLRLGISTLIRLQDLNGREVECVSACRFSPEGQ